MAMTTLEFGAWEPDAALLNGQQAPEACNVIPAKRGYRPFHSLVAVTTAALVDPVLEVFTSKGLDGELITAAATDDGIYMLEAGDWEQRHSGTVATNNRWFAQYGSALYALYGNALLKQAAAGQVYVPITTAEGFDYDAPTGELLAVIRDFLVLGRAGGVQNCIRWSGIDRPDEWPTPGTNAAQYIQSDQQVFPEGGKVMAIVGGVGGTDGIVFLERGIQRMTYVGTPYIFQFNPIDREHGLLAEKSPVVCGNACCYLSSDGWRITDGVSVKNIGAERVDNWFWEQCDSERLEEVRGIHDPWKRLAVWSFPTIQAPAGVHDRLLIYSYLLDKWSYAAVETECIYGDYARGLTLEDLDAYGDLEHLPWASLDSAILKNGGRVLGAVTTEHRLGSFSGPALQAVVDTAESGGQRMMIHGFRPLVDCGNAQAMPIWRVLQKNQRTAGKFTRQQRDGVCYQHLSCDYAAARVMVPAGEVWRNALAVEALIETEGGL